MFTKIVRIVVAVKDVEEATKLYVDNFNLKISRFGPLPEQGVKNAHVTNADVDIELVEPLDPQQGPVAKFLNSRGEGIYMVGIEVDDLDATVQSLTEKGIRLVGTDPESRAKGGPIAIHPHSTKGVLIDLIQRG